MSTGRAIHGCSFHLRFLVSRLLSVAFIILVSAFPLHPAAFQPLPARAIPLTNNFPAASSRHNAFFAPATSTQPLSFVSTFAPLFGSAHDERAGSMFGARQTLPRGSLALRRISRGRSAPFTLDMSSGIFGADDIALKSGSNCFIVGADIKRDRYKTLETSWSVDDSLDELERLCFTAGLNVVGRDYQAMQNPSPSTFIGQGKVEEIREAVEMTGSEVVVFDEELTPAQGRNLQKAIGGEDGAVSVMDRTMLILQIFAQRARTKEAKLQVEAAQLQYMLPRLQSFMTTGAGMDAKGGGGGGSGGGGRALKGAGESQIEMDRRLFRRQLGKIYAEIDAVRAKRDTFRARRRERDSLPVIAVVGYTNAGKSTMLNKLCGTEVVYADDLLFATLDPTTRKIALPGGKEILMTDTVGFIQKLPTKLVSSFKSTLEELEDASLILHLVDSASPLARQQVWSVQNIIEELMVEDTPQILVLNKADKRRALIASGELQRGGEGMEGAEAAAAEEEEEEEERGQLGVGGGEEEVDVLQEGWDQVHERVVPETVLGISAKTGEGVPELLQSIEEALLQLSAVVTCRLPYSAGELLAEIHKVGTILEEEYQEEGTLVTAYVPPSLRNRLSQYEVAGGGPAH